jgi:hypothetical protein
MTGLEHRIERDLRQIADRAVPSPDAWSSILTRISDQVLDDEPAQDSWSRVRFEVVDHKPRPFTDEQVIILDLEPPVPIDDRRKGPRGFVVAGLLAAAAVVAIAVAATNDGRDATPVDRSSPDVIATETPRALFIKADEQLVPGTYYVDEVAGSATPRISVTLGEGWRNAIDQGAIRNGGTSVLTFSRPTQVFSDACHSDDGVRPGSVTTLDGLVAALSQQRGWANVTTPTDITIDGYPGKMFQRTAPDTFFGCPNSWGEGDFRSYDNGGRAGAWAYYERGEVETLRVLDLNGTVVVIATRLKEIHESTAAAGLAAVLDSIRIEQT